MGQTGMRVTVDAAMRARDVSRPYEDAGDGPAVHRDGRKAAETPRRTKAAKNERRRLGKRGGARRSQANGL